MEKIRLQKYFTDCGIMSRRACEKEIEAGNIRVNGIPATLGDKADPERDTVTLRGRIVRYVKKDGGYTYVLLNKPIGYVSTMNDEKGRPTVRDLVAKVPVRIYPVGRLDMYSDGLLLMTDDGALTNRLTHPSGEIEKKYLLKVAGEVGAEALTLLTLPIEINGKMTIPAKVDIKKNSKESTVLEVIISEGKNRQIRRLCENAGLKVLSLTRIAIGPVTDPKLKTGKWRYLEEDEVRKLKGY